MIIKYFLLLGIIAISSYLGILKSNFYINREHELKKLLSALTMIKSKIEYTHEPVKDIFNDISKIIYNNKDNFFKDILNYKNDFCNSWNEITFKNYFKNDDIEIIRNFGMQLRQN